MSVALEDSHSFLSPLLKGGKLYFWDLKILGEFENFEKLGGQNEKGGISKFWGGSLSFGSQFLSYIWFAIFWSYWENVFTECGIQVCFAFNPDCAAVISRCLSHDICISFSCDPFGYLILTWSFWMGGVCIWVLRVGNGKRGEMAFWGGSSN